jgi:hypothetical protein
MYDKVNHQNQQGKDNESNEKRCYRKNYKGNKMLKFGTSTIMRRTFSKI